ncbi:hypothetical protein [Nonomuraea sp. NEAU-A123]|uniref:AMIN-like domain-containing (lipo)protein n=1 Tax=Nonomuraea sp. NEAU-A123 TaxID=2839649 RepID=UPI001BE41C30|nr:hypothetical protein [Nonomuraea sp. NEAU-A123]MBT2224487.1 hypothetical protein [Nonomuraea sp. NEAU-A123]
MRPSSAPGQPSGLRPARAAALVAVACLAVLTACGTTPSGGTAGGATTSAVPEAATPSTTPSAVATPSYAKQPASPTSTVEVDVQHGGGDPALVLAVRYAAHDTYDRVVIDLKGAMPGYNAQWVKKLLQDGSGKNFHVPGGAYLQILLNPAEAHNAKGEPTWKGGPIFPANLGNVTHVVKTGDFEGYVGVGLVLDHQAAFELKEQTGPDRLIIDVAH